MKRTLCALVLALAGCGSNSSTPQAIERSPRFPSGPYKQLDFVAKDGSEYNLDVESDGVNIHVVDAQKKRLGKMHFKEATGFLDGNVEPGDYFVLNHYVTEKTHIVRYHGIDMSSSTVLLEDVSKQGQYFTANFVNGYMVLGTDPRVYRFGVNLGQQNQIGVDQNANWNHAETVDITEASGRRITFDELR